MAHRAQGSRLSGPCVNSAAFTVPYTGTTSRSMRVSASSPPRQYSQVRLPIWRANAVPCSYLLDTRVANSLVVGAFA